LLRDTDAPIRSRPRGKRNPAQPQLLFDPMPERIASLEGVSARKAGCLSFGVPEIDAVLPGGGLAYGDLHEFAGGGSGT
ncbi:hypothetical protein ACC720_39180, partial [Rhizobium ruizarguesonis]